MGVVQKRKFWTTAASGSSAGGARLVRDQEAGGSNPPCPITAPPLEGDLNRLSAEQGRGKGAMDGSVSERGGSEQGAGLRLAKSKSPLPDTLLL